MALPLLTLPSMPEPQQPDDEVESHSERRVVYETVSSSSTKNSWVTITVIIVIAIALVVWIMTKGF